MSTLKVTNIQATGETASRAVSGVAAAFERHNSSHTIVSSLNVSSLSDNGTGDTSVSYTNAFAAADQIIVGSAGAESTSNRIVASIQTEASLSTSHRYQVANGTFTVIDPTVNCTIAHGDLA